MQTCSKLRKSKTSTQTILFFNPALSWRNTRLPDVLMWASSVFNCTHILQSATQSAIQLRLQPLQSKALIVVANASNLPTSASCRSASGHWVHRGLEFFTLETPGEVGLLCHMWCVCPYQLHLTTAAAAVCLGNMQWQISKVMRVSKPPERCKREFAKINLYIFGHISHIVIVAVLLLLTRKVRQLNDILKDDNRNLSQDYEPCVSSGNVKGQENKCRFIFDKLHVIDNEILKQSKHFFNEVKNGCAPWQRSDGEENKSWVELVLEKFYFYMGPSRNY